MNGETGGEDRETEEEDGGVKRGGNRDRDRRGRRLKEDKKDMSTSSFKRGEKDEG